MILFTRIVAGLGTLSMAAHQITVNAESISYMPAIGLATAGTALVGQRLGARDERGAVNVAKETLRITIIAMIGMSLAFFFLGKPYMRLYTDDVAVSDLGARMLAIAAAAQIPMGIAFAMSGVLRGAGDTLVMMGVTMVGVWAIRLTITGGLTQFMGWGLAAAWASMFFDWSFRAACAYWRFRSGAWSAVKV